MKTITKLWILVAILAILSPIGLLLPEHFKAGAAWGEWAPEEIQALVGYIPKGLEKLASLWCAPIPDYTFKGWQTKPLRSLSVAYIISAIAGIVISVVLVFLIAKLLAKKDRA
jgi:cobalt/nickel transport protein